MAGRATTTPKTEEVISEKGSGNVFRDLGFPNPEDMGRKSDLVHRIDRIIQESGLSQTQAAQKMCVDQSDLSKILRGQFRSITFDKLFEMLSALGEDSVITVHTNPDSETRRGRVMVAFGYVLHSDDTRSANFRRMLAFDGVPPPVVCQH